MPFDYSATGLPENTRWEIAADRCHAWLTENMAMFGPDRILNFMKNQPVTAALRLRDCCDDWSEELVTVALLGPAKGTLAQDEAGSRGLFGDRAVELAKTLTSETPPCDARLKRDAGRLFLVEALSGMHDQIIDRKKIDAHHQVRWNMLQNYESGFAALKGENPKLDVIFEDSLKKSRAALEALDAEKKRAAS